MAKADSSTPSTRSPRGTKPVSQAFFAALDAIPDASRAAVARAAQIMIRDELKLRRDKMKAAAAKEKARKSAPAKITKAAKAKKAPEPAPATAPKRRGRKSATVPIAA